MKRLLVIVALTSAFAQSQTVQPLLQPRQTFVNSAGLPCTGCKLYSYAAGTTTPLATYKDSTGVPANTNPIVLDVAGGANIWIKSFSYKFTLVGTDGSTIWTVDNVNTAGGFAGFLPLTGGTLTGPLNGTSANFSGPFAAQSIGGIWQVNPSLTLDFCQNLSAALVAAQSAGYTVVDTTAITGAQTCSVDPFAAILAAVSSTAIPYTHNPLNMLIVFGPVTVTSTVPWNAPFSRATFVGAGKYLTNFVYTGASTRDAFQIGAVASAVVFSGVQMSGISFYANANATNALAMRAVSKSKLDSVSAWGGSTYAFISDISETMQYDNMTINNALAPSAASAAPAHGLWYGSHATSLSPNTTWASTNSVFTNLSIEGVTSTAVVCDESGGTTLSFRGGTIEGNGTAIPPTSTTVPGGMLLKGSLSRGCVVVSIEDLDMEGNSSFDILDESLYVTVKGGVYTTLGGGNTESINHSADPTFSSIGAFVHPSEKSGTNLAPFLFQTFVNTPILRINDAANGDYIYMGATSPCGNSPGTPCPIFEWGYNSSSLPLITYNWRHYGNGYQYEHVFSDESSSGALEDTLVIKQGAITTAASVTLTVGGQIAAPNLNATTQTQGFKIVGATVLAGDGTNTYINAQAGTGGVVLDAGDGTHYLLVGQAGTLRANAYTTGVATFGSTGVIASTTMMGTGSIPTMTASTPANNAACTAGQMWFDTGFIYVCTASGTVKRAALTTF